MSDQQLFNQVLANFKNHEFDECKNLGVQCNGRDLRIFEIDYYASKLNALENFEEGEFVLADKIKFRRYYAPCPTATDPGMYTFCTEVSDVTQQQKHASLAMVHGFAQCQDVFFEAAIHFALNGFYVYLVDLEGFGFSAGSRINRLTVEKFHH